MRSVRACVGGRRGGSGRCGGGLGEAVGVGGGGRTCVVAGVGWGREAERMGGIGWRKEGLAAAVVLLAWSRAAGGRSSSLRMPMTLLMHLGTREMDCACDERRRHETVVRKGWYETGVTVQAKRGGGWHCSCSVILDTAGGLRGKIAVSGL